MERQIARRQFLRFLAGSLLTPEGLAPALERAFREGGVQLVVASIDYSENTRVLIDELRGAAPKRE